MKSVAKITPVEGGYVYGSDKEDGAKVGFAPTLLEAVQAAIAFQAGMLPGTPDAELKRQAVTLRRGANGWAIALPRMLGADILDVLPMGATEMQITSAIAKAMEPSEDHDERNADAAALAGILN